MFVVVYRWFLKSGFEQRHRQGWRQVTAAIARAYATGGSRLHLNEDGAWVAYAVWPDEATFVAAQRAAPVASPEDRELMREGLAGPIEVLFRMTPTDDLLTLPSPEESVEIVPWDSQWPAQFAAEQAQLEAAFAELRPAIEHIGSTAVPQLCSRPIIDIMAGLTELWLPGKVLQALGALGYGSLGETEGGGRLQLRKRGAPSYDLAVVLHQGALWRDNLRRRDRLRADPELARRYGDHKRALVAAGKTRRLAYAAAKAGLVQELLAEPPQSD